MTRLETADHALSASTVNPRFGSSGEAPVFHEDEKPQEKCGVTGIYSKIGENVSHFIPAMQHHLRHRGYDTAGMAVFHAFKNNGNGVAHNGDLIIYKGAGRPDEVFQEGFDFAAHNLVGDRAAGHNRYGTSGGNHKDNLDGAQPMKSSWKGKSIAIQFNGNLPESEREILRDRIPLELRKDRETGFDTNDIADAIVSSDGEDDVEKIRNGLEGISMAYSLTILTDQGRLFGLRGPSGTWPLWVGETDTEILFSSETRVGKVFENKEVQWREVKPGELVEATPEGVVSRQLFEPIDESICMLHAVYGARGDSLMTQDATYFDFRKRIGEILAEEHPIEADVYVGVPTTGRHIAVGYAEALGKPLTDVIVTRDDTRSYIAKSPEEAARIVNGKFEIPDPSLVEGKSIVAIEDSLIKGTTAGGDPEKKLLGVVGMLRLAGARQVHFLAGLPKFTSDCDMGYVVKKDTLAAVVRQEDGSYLELTEEEIAQKIGADSFRVISMEGMSRGVEDITGKRDIACTACMGGLHPLNKYLETILFELVS